MHSMHVITDDQTAANVAHRRFIPAIVFLPALLVWGAVLAKLVVDYNRVCWQAD